ncbi:RNA-directed DNA polymerase, eukaryota [Tanacetum coccineum]
MDDPNITMEEYIRLEEEKAQRHGQTFNCQTATYGKMEYCEDEDDSFTNFETEYPTIVFDDTSDATLSCEPTVSPLNENEIDFRISFDESDDKDYMIWHLYHLGIRLFEIRAPLVLEFIRWVELEAGFGAYWQGSERVIPDKGDLRDYWIEISSDKDFLGLAPSYVFIRDPVRRLFHKMIAYSIFGKGQAPKKACRGEEKRSMLSRGHFIGCLAAHFGLVSDQGLRGLPVVTRELPLIDFHELERLNIYLKIGDTWAWVAPGPERLPDAAAGAPGAAEEAPANNEGAQKTTPKKRTTRASPATTTTTTTTPVTNAQLKALIDQGVADALAARDTDRSMNGDGVVELTQGFERMETKSHVRTVGHDVAYAITWTNMKKKMTDKYCPRAKIKKLEAEMWNLNVKGTDVVGYNQCFQELALISVMASKPKTMQNVIEFATELMDQKISTLAERQAENKRKLDNNNQAQQQPPKKQGVAIAYATESGERKEYAGTLPSLATTNNQRNLTCYECGNQGHYKSDCPELKNQNHRNQAGGTGARGMVHALRGGETNQDLNDMEDDINA